MTLTSLVPPTKNSHQQAQATSHILNTNARTVPIWNQTPENADVQAESELKNTTIQSIPFTA